MKRDRRAAECRERERPRRERRDDPALSEAPVSDTERALGSRARERADPARSEARPLLDREEGRDRSRRQRQPDQPAGDDSAETPAGKARTNDQHRRQRELEGPALSCGTTAIDELEDAPAWMPASSVVSRARGQGRDLFLAEADEPLRGHVHDPLAAGLIDAEPDQRDRRLAALRVVAALELLERVRARANASS